MNQIKSMEMTDNKMINKLFYWAPRTLAILAVLFLMFFFLDCFRDSQKLGKLLLCILTDIVPSLILSLVVAAAWKWELIGGIVLIVLVVVISNFVHGFFINTAMTILFSLVLLSGILFVLHHILFRKKLKRT